MKHKAHNALDYAIIFISFCQISANVDALRLFSEMFGLQLFLRQLYCLGAVMAAWRVFVILISIIPMSANAREGVVSLLFVVDVGVVVWLGLKGNEYLGKNLLNHGGVSTKPDSLGDQFAASRWGIELTAAATA